MINTPLSTYHNSASLMKKKTSLIDLCNYQLILLALAKLNNAIINKIRIIVDFVSFNKMQ